MLVSDFQKVLEDVGAEPDDHLIITKKDAEIFGESDEVFALRQQLKGQPIHTIVYIP